MFNMCMESANSSSSDSRSSDPLFLNLEPPRSPKFTLYRSTARYLGYCRTKRFTVDDREICHFHPDRQFFVCLRQVTFSQHHNFAGIIFQYIGLHIDQRKPGRLLCNSMESDLYPVKICRGCVDVTDRRCVAATSAQHDGGYQRHS